MPDPKSPVTAPVPAPEPAFFDNPAIDHLIAVTLELGAELCVQRDRLRTIETLLAEKGFVTAEMIDAHVPPPDVAARARAERHAFVQRVYGAFARETVPATPTSAE